MTDGKAHDVRVGERSLVVLLSEVAVEVARFNYLQFEMPHLVRETAAAYVREYSAQEARDARTDDNLLADYRIHDEEDPRSWLPEDTISDILTSLAKDAYGAPAARESSSGSPPRFEDAAAHAMFVSLLRNSERLRARVRAIAGEEARTADWDEFNSLAPGEYGVILDAIDGTSVAAATGTNWVVTLLLYRRTTKGWDVRAVITADPTRRVQVGNRKDKAVQIIHGDDRVDLLSATGDPHSIDPWSIAVVAAHGYARERVAPLFVTDGIRWGLPDKPHAGGMIATPALSVYTVGGAPVLAQMPTSSLGFAVIPTWSTVHDAAPLVALALLEDSFEFYRFDRFEQLTPRQVIRLFNDVHRPPGALGDVAGPGTYRPIPPILVSRIGGGGAAIVRPGDLGLPGDRVVDRILRALHESFETSLGLHVGRPPADVFD